MSTKVQNFHLSKESRYILYRLRSEIDFQLNKDITEGFSRISRSLGNLLPLIYQAFIKIWCNKIPLICRKSSYSKVASNDVHYVRIPVDTFNRLVKDSSQLHSLLACESADLPF